MYLLQRGTYHFIAWSIVIRYYIYDNDMILHVTWHWQALVTDHTLNSQRTRLTQDSQLWDIFCEYVGKYFQYHLEGYTNIEYCFTLPDHGDVMIWKCCPHYRPFVQGIHHRVVIWSFGIFFYISLNALVNNSQIPCDKRCHGVTHIDWLMQERRNSIANALELHLSCTNPSVDMTVL